MTLEWCLRSQTVIHELSLGEIYWVLKTLTLTEKRDACSMEKFLEVSSSTHPHSRKDGISLMLEGNTSLKSVEPGFFNQSKCCKWDRNWWDRNKKWVLMMTLCALCPVMSLAVVVRKDKYELSVADLYADHLTQVPVAETAVKTWKQRLEWEKWVLEAFICCSACISCVEKSICQMNLVCGHSLLVLA